MPRRICVAGIAIDRPEESVVEFCRAYGRHTRPGRTVRSRDGRYLSRTFRKLFEPLSLPKATTPVNRVYPRRHGTTSTHATYKDERLRESAGPPATS